MLNAIQIIIRNIFPIHSVGTNWIDQFDIDELMVREERNILDTDARILFPILI